MEHFLISPSDVSRLTRFTPDMLRDWRHKGLLEQFGQSTRGRWKYSVSDTVALWLVYNISGGMINREACSAIGAKVSEQIINYVKGGGYFHTVSFEVSPHCSFVVDIPEISDTLPENIRSLITQTPS